MESPYQWQEMEHCQHVETDSHLPHHSLFPPCLYSLDMCYNHFLVFYCLSNIG